MFVQTRDNRGLMLTDKSQEELEAIAVPLSGLDKLQAQAQEQMASVARIPLSIYLQVTPTGLNATNDGETRNFYADVHSYQEKNVRGPLKLVIDLIQLSLFGAIDPAISFEFLPLWEMSDKDRADIRKADAEADVAYVTAGVVSNEETRQRLANDTTSLYYGVDLSDPAPDVEDDDEAVPVAKDGWSEGDHPRDQNGKFARSGGSSASVRAFAAQPTIWTSKASGIEYVKNALPQVSREKQSSARMQQNALEDAFADGADKFFRTEKVNPADLNSLQNQVARNQVVEVSEKRSFNSTENGELPLAVRGPDGLILIDGNHRANAALLAGEKLDVQVFNYEDWQRDQESKKAKPGSNKSGPSDDDLLAELLG